MAKLDAERKITSREKRDRISQLPKELLHHILSFLPTDESVATSILSRKWNEVWTTLPCLNFNIQYPPFGVPPTDEYLDFIDKTIDNRGKMQSMCIQSIHLRVGRCDYKLAGYVGILVQRLTRYDVKELIIELSQFYSHIESMCGVPKSSFPKAIFLGKSITVLRLSSCRLGTILATDIDLVSLKKLSLEQVFDVSDLLIERISATSPGLKKLSLKYCGFVTSFTGIRNSSLITLKMCGLYYNHRRLEIDAPKLLHLKIDYCKMLNFLFISSNSLRSLELSRTDGLTKAEFKTPNLQSLKLHGEMIFSISFNAPPKMKSEHCFSLRLMGQKGFIDLLNL